MGEAVESADDLGEKFVEVSERFDPKRKTGATATAFFCQRELEKVWGWGRR